MRGNTPAAVRFRDGKNFFGTPEAPALRRKNDVCDCGNHLRHEALVTIDNKLRSGIMHSIFYIIGVVVVVLAILSFVT